MSDDEHRASSDRSWTRPAAATVDRRRRAASHAGELAQRAAGSAERNLGLVGVLVAAADRRRDHPPDMFLTDRSANVLTVLTQASVIGVITVGMTFVIIGGGIDLSVGALWRCRRCGRRPWRPRSTAPRGDGLPRAAGRRGRRPGQRRADRLRHGWCRSSPPWR